MEIATIMEESDKKDQIIKDLELEVKFNSF